jgi:hypothetical protein
MGESSIVLPEWRKGHSRLNPTVAALIGRGVDTKTAAELRRKGWTLGKLQQQPPEVLQSLGIRPDTIERILDSERPPIPFATLAQLLIANRMTCCVCQNPDRGVILHHLVDWAQSHSHDEQNLAVLCLIDHDRAHSKLAHTQNLTVPLIKEFKETWQHRVRELGMQAILSAAAKDFDCWWYFNRTRLFAMAESKPIALTQVNQFRTALLNGWINSEGYPLQRNHYSNYSLEGGDGGAMYAYLKAVFDETISSASVLNISNDLDRNFLKAVLRPGHLIFLQGSFRFVEKDSCLNGPGQTVEMYRRANDVCVTSTIDRWEATSNSAWSSYLKGVYEVSAVMRVVTVQHLDGELKIQGSSIAIGAPLDGMKTREYSNAPYRRGYYVWDDVGEEDEYEGGGGVSLDFS